MGRWVLAGSGRKKEENMISAMCKHYLISVNHDECLLNYVSEKNSRGKKQSANVSIKEKQKKREPKVKKPKKVESHKSLATPTPRKPRSFLRWSPTRRMFDINDTIIASSKSESQSDCSKGDNACTSNPVEPTIKRFPNATFSLAGFGDLQWVNILITRVYFVEGLGHNLFSVGQFCDSDLEVAFRRDACFVRNLEGVDLLKGARLTNLYTINLHEMASASPICPMARLPKFKYQKEHLFPSCEQGKRKRASYPPKPVPNLRQRLHLLHMDLFGPMRIASINGKRTMLIFSRAPLFLWAEAIATACFTQNRSIIHRFNKTPNELINGRKPDISFLHVFGALCYPKNDREDIGKLGAKGDIGFFIGYSADSCAYRVYNHRTKKILEIMNALFDKLSAMAFEQCSSKPGLQSMTSRHISSRLDLTYAPSTITMQQPSEDELDLLFEAMYDDYIGGQPSATARTVSPTQETQVRQTSTASTTIVDTALIPTNSSSLATNIPITLQDVDELNPNAMVDGNTFVNLFANPSTSAATASSSQQNVDPSNMHTFYQPYLYELQWTKDHPLEQALSVSTMEPKNVKEAMTDPVWIDSMQEELLQFKRLDGTLKEDVYVCQPEGFIDADHPSHVYKLKKALYRLKQAPRGLSKYVLEILNKYGMESYDPVGTLMKIKDKLDLYQNGTPVDATKYRCMIGALLYLTSSRPDIVHATCLCARYQAKPTEKHLKEVKRIFHYLWGTLNMGLWYTKDFGFELTGFSNADYARCKDTFKSTASEAQFLGEKLTDYQLADIFTKALPTDRFNYLVRRLGMRSLSSKELKRLAKSQ
nr:hypothetical protein [Tanacetum cinerariifolium]